MVGVTWPPIPCGTTGVVHAIGCGDRNWSDPAPITASFDALFAHYPLLTVVDGEGRGADRIVGAWARHARSRGVHHIPLPAHWDDYPRNLRWMAGHDRNQAMLEVLLRARDHGHGVVVVAFKGALTPDLRTGGTENMMRIAIAAGIDVWYAPDGTPRPFVPDSPSPVPLF